MDVETRLARLEAEIAEIKTDVKWIVKTLESPDLQKAVNLAKEVSYMKKFVTFFTGVISAVVIWLIQVVVNAGK